MKSRGHRWFLGAGVVSALLASLCCLGPLVALLLGAGTFAAASWFAAWRPVFLAITFALLGAGWVFALRRRRASCATEGAACASDRGGRASFLLLVFATLAAGGFAAYPLVAGRVAAAVSDHAPTGANQTPIATDVRTLTVRIPSMDCEACAAGIAATLRREPGVVSAEVTYATKDAIIRYDAAATTSARIVAAIDATGFPAVALTEVAPTP